MIKGKRIIYGVTGSIAAVKAPIIARELMRRGADVFPALTRSASEFTTPYALSILTQYEAITDIFPSSQSQTTWHIHLARSADAMLIAPCSATTLGKLRYGVYDNVVTLLAASLPQSIPLIIAPAMDEEMWLQPAVQENIAWLRGHGVGVIDPISGALASGLEGLGRMHEPSEIVTEFEKRFESLPHRPAQHVNLALAGKRVLISGGPTYEPIDPVRFIGNRSSGKMAAALANEAATVFGASVSLVMGPSSVTVRDPVRRINVETTDEMRTSLLEQLPAHDIIIMAAAVSDYRVKDIGKTKLKKKSKEVPSLELEQTADILQEIVKKKRVGQIVIGFALESASEGEVYARKKLEEKELDMIILNAYDEHGAGFSTDTNKVTIFTRRGLRRELALMKKTECAREILSTITDLI